MMDPVKERQLQELDQVGLCVQIFSQARNELYLSMPFLDVALSSFQFEAQWDLKERGLRTDGRTIFYQPDLLLDRYQRGRVLMNRAYLHMLLHCLFGHMDTRGKREKALWDISCDIAAESVIDGLIQSCTHLQPGAFRRETYLRIRKELNLRTLTAGGVYRALAAEKPGEKRLKQLAGEFLVDSHGQWEEPEQPKAAMERRNRWNDRREQMQTALEMGAEQGREDNESLLEELSVENRERYDYCRFLRRFAVLKEEREIDPDSFDYGLYSYGLSLYGNTPLLEPQETREVCRVEDFVIVIDTSMSCSGQLVRRFLEETGSILSEQEHFFRTIHLHVIQCDDQVRQDAVLKSPEEFQRFLENFQIRGGGGTDFRPAFEYVESLRRSGAFTRLRGLIYFTDGKGIYPVQAPSYDTAFVFIRNQYQEEAVPAWAMKLILEPEELWEKGTMGDVEEIFQKESLT